MPTNVHGEGPIPARIMIVGEAPGSEETISGHPFVGQSGQELSRMLHEAGILRNECFVTNVCRQQPKWNDIKNFIPETKKGVTPDMVLVRDRYCSPVVRDGLEMLKKEIAVVKPQLIITLGGTALWALTGNTGITSWRGSVLKSDIGVPTKVLATYHPAAILRQWDWRHITVHDLRRAKKESEFPEIRMPEYRFTVRPTFDFTMALLATLQDTVNAQSYKISVDIETRRGHIACLGIAWNRLEAICIPFMTIAGDHNYWNLEQETAIIGALRRLLTHPNAQIIGQNFLYDTQYIYTHWKFVPNLQYDTMLRQHVCFPGLPKGLDFISSLYCEFHQYWKDEGKEWHPALPEEQLWTYNCKDAVITYEANDALEQTIQQLKLVDVAQFQMNLFWPVLYMMTRGVRLDQTMRKELAKELGEALEDREKFLERVLGHPLNPRSPKQMHALFYNDFAMKPIINRKTKTPTLNDEALTKLTEREPLLRPITGAIADMRTLGVFKSTFVESEQDADGRMRCSFNPAGTETFRFASSENAFGRGMNLQNVPSDKSKSLNKAKQRGSLLELPNVRKVFIPDPGHTFWDMDLDRADLQVVVWESDDKELKLALRMGADLHLMNACALANLKTPPIDELVETHPNYRAHRTRLKGEREFAKTFIHGTNYGGSPATMAAHTGISVKQAELFQKRWFGAHPGIFLWHSRTLHQLMATRSVANKFGYRRFYFDRIDSVLPEALAWVPQSTVACVINRALVNITLNLPEVEILLQVHDSLAGQFPSNKPELAQAIVRLGHIEIPYDDPLTIPCGIKLSTESWGECK